MKNIHFRSLLIVLALSITFSCQNSSIIEETNSNEFKSDSNSMAPYLYLDKEQSIFASWIEDNNEATLKFSKYENNSWSKPKNIANGADWFVNWADYPIITSDGKGNLLSHFLRKNSSDTYSYDIYMVISNDDGESWGNELILNSDGTNSEHGFVSAIPYKEGFLVSWLDGRNTVSGGPMSLRAVHMDANGNKLNEWEIDTRVCDCCQTTLVMSKYGPFIAYRNRDENEVRDIAFSQLKDNEWTEPKIVFSDNWKIRGCPVNGPRLAATKDELAISWFTSPDGKNGLVKLSMFDYETGEFKDPILLSHSVKTVGRVDIEFGNSGELFTTWIENDSIQLARLNLVDHTVSITKAISKISPSRKSGFPQIAIRQSQLMLLYTNIDSKKLESMVIEVE